MNVQPFLQTTKADVYRFSLREDGQEIARVRLILIRNDIHQQPYGLIEDLWVDESKRGKGYAKQLLATLKKRAENCSCYKLIANSGTENKDVHKLYQKFGFVQYGFEFRMTL